MFSKFSFCGIIVKRIGEGAMKILKYIYLGLISPYLALKKYFHNSIKDVTVYKYKALTSDNKKESDYLCIKEKIIKNFFIVENKKLLSVKTNFFIKYRFRHINKNELSKKEIVYFLTQVNSFVKAGHNIISSISLIIKKCKYKNLERVLRLVRYDLMCGNDLATALSMQGNSFPRLLITVLHDKSISDEQHLIELENYYKTLYLNEVDYNKTWMYKIFVIPYALLVLVFIFGYIIPQFYILYKLFLNEELTFLKRFLKLKKYSNSIFIIFVILIGILLFLVLGNGFKKFKQKFEMITMKIFRKTITSKQLVIFSKTFSLIIKYNIKDKDVIKNITDNNYFQQLINKSFDLYRENQIISSALKHEKYFSPKDYDMIKTGEKFDSLLLQVNNISNYYQKQFAIIINRNMKIIGPIIIIFSTIFFGSIILILLFQCLMIIK